MTGTSGGTSQIMAAERRAAGEAQKQLAVEAEIGGAKGDFQWKALENTQKPQRIGGELCDSFAGRQTLVTFEGLEQFKG